MKPKIGFLLKPLRREHATPILSEVFSILEKRSVDVEVIVPEENLITLPALKVTCDLYVLRPGVELALSIAGILHDKGARIINNYPASNLVQDKCRVIARLQDHGFPTPPTYVTGNPKMVLDAVDVSRFVIKPHRGSGGTGVEFVPRERMLNCETCDALFIQDCLDSDGEDLKVYVIGREVFAIKRPYPARTFEEKLGYPAAIRPEIRRLALKVGEVFDLEIYGIDILETDRGPFVVDVNYFPGMIGVPQAANRIADYLYHTLKGFRGHHHETSPLLTAV